MKRFLFLLTLVLIALALTGCVENKPAPRLHSPDRNERLDAVRETQKKYGAHTPDGKGQ